MAPDTAAPRTAPAPYPAFDGRLSTRYEPVFLFSKSPRYWFDLDPIREEYATPETRGARAPALETDRTPYPSGVNPQSQRGRTGRQRTFMGSDLGRNPGDVWTIATQPFGEAHFACMPVALAERCIRTSKPDAVVLDPFSGSGTTGLAASKLGRRYVGIDLNRDYLDLSLRTRLAQAALIDGEAS